MTFNGTAQGVSYYLCFCPTCPEQVVSLHAKTDLRDSLHSFSYTLYLIQQQLLKHHLINLLFPISFIIILVEATIAFFSWTLTDLLPLYNPFFKSSHGNTFYFIEKYKKLSKYKEFYNSCQYTHQN